MNDDRPPPSGRRDDGDRLRLALDAAGAVGTFVFDAATDRLDGDARFWSLHGAASRTVIRRLSDLKALVAVGDRERLGTVLRAVGDGSLPRLLVEYAASVGGQPCALLLRGGRLDDGRVAGIVLDITEQRDVEAALRESEMRFEAITNSIDQMIWSTTPDGYHDYYNRRWYEFTGVPEGTTDGEGWNGMFHPDDQERAWSRWRHSLATGEPYHIEYRLRHRSGAYRWVIGRAQCVRDETGRIVRWYGTCTDINDLKEAEAQRELIARELSHRIRNIFAVVSSLVMLPTRAQPESRPFALSVQARIQALAAAHDYVRPHSPASATPGPQTVQGLLTRLVEPYNAADRSRIVIDGDDSEIGLQAATALALIVHELATNAVKYGALATEGGIVGVATAATEDRFVLVWRESGGPRVAGPPTRSGFGTSLSERVVQMQLNATFTREWLPTGLVVTIDMPTARLAA